MVRDVRQTVAETPLPGRHHCAHGHRTAGGLVLKRQPQTRCGASGRAILSPRPGASHQPLSGTGRSCGHCRPRVDGVHRMPSAGDAAQSFRTGSPGSHSSTAAGLANASVRQPSGSFFLGSTTPGA